MKKLSILAVGSLILFTAGCSKQEKAVKAPMDYISSNSAILLKVDAQSIFKNQKLRELITSNEKVMKEFKAVGFSLDDINSVVAGFSSPEKVGHNNPDGCVVFSFNKEFNLEAVLKETKGEFKKSEYSGVTIYTDQRGTDVKTSIAKVESNKIVVGPEKGVKKSIDVANGKGENVAANGKLMSLYDKVKGKGGVTFAVDTSQLPKNKQAEAFHSVTGWLNNTNNAIVGKVNADAKSEKGAKEIATQMNMMVNMFGGMLTQGVITSKQIAIKAEDKTLAVSINISEAEIKKLSEIASKPNPMLNKMIK